MLQLKWQRGKRVRRKEMACEAKRSLVALIRWSEDVDDELEWIEVKWIKPKWTCERRNESQMFFEMFGMWIPSTFMQTHCCCANYFVATPLLPLFRAAASLQFFLSVSLFLLFFLSLPPSLLQEIEPSFIHSYIHTCLYILCFLLFLCLSVIVSVSVLLFTIVHV